MDLSTQTINEIIKDKLTITNPFSSQFRVPAFRMKDHKELDVWNASMDLIIAKRLDYITNVEKLFDNLTNIMKMLSVLIRYYKKNESVLGSRK